MPSAEERLRVLKMIETGQISPEEGVHLLAGNEPSQAPAQETSQPQESTGHAPTARWLRVLVTDITSGKTKVNVRLPANLLHAGARLGARLSTQIDGVDMGQLGEYIRDGYTGQVLDVLDEDENEHVQVYLE